jgi:hypothetical protein
MYTLNSTSRMVSETTASPYFASVNVGQNRVLVVAEITGQYVYLSTFKFQTSAGTYPIAVDVTATLKGSSKSFQLNPITLARS